MSDENFLSRWSRKKAASKVGPAGQTADVPAKPTSAAGPVGPTADVVPAQAGTQSQRGAPAAAETRPAEPLPPVESLTPESDFTPFMKPDVDPGVKRQALKALFQDPQFNVMDGLDTYIADYSQPDPLPEGWLEKMNQVKHLGIFSEPAEAAEAAPGVRERAEKPPEEQPVDDSPPVEGPDTSSAQISPAPAGKSTPTRGGDPDILV